MIEDLVFADKPSGWLTHSDGQTQGFVDLCKERLKEKNLKIVHRLDRETSGAMVFARNRQAAATLTELFSEKKMAKEYFFVTDRSVSFQKKEVDQNGEQTLFEKEDEELQAPPFFLWKARPLTGKTHQIRRHAQLIGLPLLGDQQYGGSAFSKIMLHCSKLHCDLFEHKVQTPLLMKSLIYLKRPRLSSWLCQLDRRQRLFKEPLSHPKQTLRLIHDKAETGYACDRFGPVLWFYRFLSEKISQEELVDIEEFCQIVGAKRFLIRQMDNRGEDPQLHSHKENEENQWEVEENSRKFLIHSDRGWSPGLFLDQRANRDWIEANAQDQDVLNLFCYTAGFSIAAALGGAHSVASVDTSKQTLNWAKENFALNQINIESHQFWAMDTREFLKIAIKQRRKFDLIICDPPSFARSKKGSFRIEKEFLPLLEQMSACLTPAGRILFSCNYEKWTYQQLLQLIPKRFQVSATPVSAGDFELPGADLTMKSVFISP